MKLLTCTITLFLSLTAASGFAPQPTSSKTSSSSSSSSALDATRRDVFQSAALMGIFLIPQVASAEARPMYLTEPTAEFKANEEKAMAFKRAQLLIKKEFQDVLGRLMAEGDDADALEKDMKAIQAAVAKNGGLPLGIKKEELFKTIRSKKAKGFWPTKVEVA
jgi:hypothetical protein